MVVDVDTTTYPAVAPAVTLNIEGNLRRVIEADLRVLKTHQAGLPQLFNTFVVVQTAVKTFFEPVVPVAPAPAPTSTASASWSSSSSSSSNVLQSSEWLSSRFLQQPEDYGYGHQFKDKKQQTLSLQAAAEKIDAFERQRQIQHAREHDDAIYHVLISGISRSFSGYFGQTIPGPELHNLQSLPIVVLTKAMSEQITQLTLTRCRLKALPLEISLLANLERLIVDGSPGSTTGNQLSALPDTIGLLVKLRYVSVANNRIVTLPLSLCRLPALETLWINNNNIISLPGAIASLSKLERLVVCDNLLSFLPCELATMTKLTTLVYTNNPLRYPPRAHDMNLRALFDYMKLHPNVVESAIRTEMSAAIDDRFADLHLHAPAGVVAIHQAMAWARATAERSDAAVPLWRNEPPLPPSGAPSGAGPLVVSSLSADEALLRRFALFLYTATIKDISDFPLMELIQAQGVPLMPTDLQMRLAHEAGTDPNVMGAALGRLYASGRFCDLEIKVGGDDVPLEQLAFAVAARRSSGDAPPPQSFRVHRFVLAARSPYFRALLSSGMTEASATTLAYPDIDADAFAAFLHYLYNDTLDLTLLQDCSVQTLILAVRFGVDRLSSMLQQLIVDNIDCDVACSIFVLGRTHSMPDLRLKLKPFMYAHLKRLQSTPDWSLLSPADKDEISK